ncbi:MAG: hypothetical protein JWP87_1234 [Labilithrix sp.]|nr:hypothetical protein [Labilithrix sp.]
MKLLSRSLVLAFASLALLATTPACNKARFYDSRVKINRIMPVRVAPDGKPLDLDVEFDWFQCPGTQIEIIRGTAAFADCMKQYKPGDDVKVRVEYHWQSRQGVWDWDVNEMGGCLRPPDDDDLSSFDTVQECEPIVANGVEEGFKCNRIPAKALLAKCPWFARH